MKTLLEQIEDVVAYSKQFKNIKQVTETKVYRHKTNKDDVVTSLDEGVAKGLNLADYEIVTTKESPTDNIRKMISDKPITDTDFKLVNDFLFTVEAVKIAEKPKDPFNLKRAALYQKILKAKDNPEKLEAATKDLIQHYIDNDRKPKKLSPDKMKLYNEMKGNK